MLSTKRNFLAPRIEYRKMSPRETVSVPEISFSQRRINDAENYSLEI